MSNKTFASKGARQNKESDVMRAGKVKHVLSKGRKEYNEDYFDPDDERLSKVINDPVFARFASEAY